MSGEITQRGDNQLPTLRGALIEGAAVLLEETEIVPAAAEAAAKAAQVSTTKLRIAGALGGLRPGESRIGALQHLNNLRAQLEAARATLNAERLDDIAAIRRQLDGPLPQDERVQLQRQLAFVESFVVHQVEVRPPHSLPYADPKSSFK